RIRRDIQDAHHHGLGQVERVTAAAQLHDFVSLKTERGALPRLFATSGPTPDQCWLAGLPIGASPFSRSRLLPLPLPPIPPPSGVAVSSQPAGGFGSRPSMMSLI